MRIDWGSPSLAPHAFDWNNSPSHASKKVPRMNSGLSMADVAMAKMRVQGDGSEPAHVVVAKLQACKHELSRLQEAVTNADAIPTMTLEKLRCDASSALPPLRCGTLYG